MNINSYLEQLQLESVGKPSADLSKILKMPIKDLEKNLEKIIKIFNIKKIKNSNIENAKLFVKQFPKLNFKEVKKQAEDKMLDFEDFRKLYKKDINLSNDIIIISAAISSIYSNFFKFYGKVTEEFKFRKKIKKLEKIKFFEKNINEDIKTLIITMKFDIYESLRIKTELEKLTIYDTKKPFNEKNPSKVFKNVKIHLAFIFAFSILLIRLINEEEIQLESISNPSSGLNKILEMPIKKVKKILKDLIVVKNYEAVKSKHIKKVKSIIKSLPKLNYEETLKHSMDKMPCFKEVYKSFKIFNMDKINVLYFIENCLYEKPYKSNELLKKKLKKIKNKEINNNIYFLSEVIYTIVEILYLEKIKGDNNDLELKFTLAFSIILIDELDDV